MNSNFGELNDIFIERKSTPKNLIPIIKSLIKIPNIISYLNDTKNDFKNKIKLIEQLTPLFKSNENFLALFVEKGTINNSPNLFHILINLYLDKHAVKEDLTILEEFINIILYNISIPKSAIEYIYHKFSKFFDSEENINFCRCLRILNIFYGSDIPKKLDKYIKNYFYFNGKNSSLKFNINKNSKNLNSDFPTLEYGFTFIFWLFLKKDLIQDFFVYFPSILIYLININIKEHNIQLILKNINTIIITLNKEEIGNIDLNKTLFKYDDWNFISFYMAQEIKGKQNACLKLIINDSKELIKIQLRNDFPLNEKIKAINLFENLIGKVSSVLFFSFCVDMELLDYLRNNYKRGFYKNKYLFHFLYMNDKDYFKNFRNYKYCIKYKKDKNPLNLLTIINTPSQKIKNIISFFCPFASKKNSKIVDDIFGHFIGVLNQDDGIIKYKNHIKYINNIGGLNNILPLGELIFLNNKNILTKESFKEFITLLKTIFINNLNTLSEAYTLNFFSTLALFLERIDKNFYDKKILEIFLLLGKEELNFSKDNIIFDNIEEENEKDNFIRDILLNIKIITKFDIYNQILLWDNLHLFLKKDYYQIKTAFNIPKINIILRYYDESKFTEYCCSYHSNLFINSNNNQIMNPDLNKKTEKIFDIIQLYLDKLTHEDEDDTNLFKLLCLDFSPCIQKKIICIYISHFSNENITQDLKIKTAKNLIKNNFLDILEYIFSISLIDIKIELVKMLSIMMKYISNNSYFNKKIPTEMIDIISFIGENILPEQLITKINQDNIKININNNNKKTQFELLSNYYNKKEYEIKVKELWSLLKNFKFKIHDKENNNEEKKENKLEINEIFINLMRHFVSKNIITEHIYEFIQIMQGFLKRKDIRNIYILYEKDFLYFWLIKTIFYFNIRENTKDISKNKLYEDIKNSSIDLLQELFKRSEGKEKFNRIRYVLYYAYRLKLILNKNISCINDIEIITRKLLNIFLENKRIDLNYEQLTILSYEFILFFKNSDKYIEENTNQNAQRNEIIENLSKRKLTKSLFVFSNPEMNINNSDEDLLNINYEKMIEEREVIPECIYEGFFYDNKNDININNNNKKNWIDFPICEKIIKYYSSKFWGLDKICLNVNVNSKKKSNELYLELIKEYTENKNYKNILYKELLQLLNLNDNNKKNSLNILSINAQLLSIAYSLSHENKELDKIEQNIIHLIIYCVLSSFNINPTEKEFTKIQEHLYNILGFLFLLIQYQNSSLYREIINKYISPIFSKIYSTLNKKSFFNIFNKKNIYSNSAIFILFEYVKNSKSNNINTKHRRFTTFTSNLDLGKSISDNKNFIIINDDYKINFVQSGSVSMKLTEENKKQILKNFFQKSFIYYKTQFSRIISNKINSIKLSYNYNKLKKEDEIVLINDTKERNRVNKSIINLITSLENDLKKYFNIFLFTDKKRRNNYKSIKKKLFSFCGFWSNKKIFYENPTILKLKKANFLSQEMSQFLLKSILDIEYELPNFKKFEKKNLFNKNNISYKINLNIDEILLKEKNINDKDIKIVINKSKKNFIESIYKYTFNKIWDKYNSYNKQNVYKENISLNNRVTYDVLVSNKFRMNNNEKNKYENIYFCCLIKQTHHICGYISTEKNKIIFLYDSEESNDYIKDDYGFDMEMNCCFGSIFRKHQKDKDIINFNIKYDEIKYMFYKIYFYNLSALEIYTISNKSFLFNFKNNKNLSQFINDILNHAKFQEIKLSENSSKILGYCHLGNTPLSITSKKNWNIFPYIKYEDWRKHKISTLELLMWLNILSGRSFHDMTQYPIFPWVMTNFQNDELNLSENIRNMSLPIGMLNTSKESRRETFIEIYDSVKSDLNEIDPGFKYQNFLSKGNEYYDNYIQNKLKLKKTNNEINIIQPNQLPYFYGTHYSNATYVSHYLTRIFPFTFISVEIQGEKFDDKDRLFISMQKTFESAMTLKDDVRELIPEFFNLPEMFLNLNNLNFNNDEEINNILLPPWAKGSVYLFVAQLRIILEKDNLNINEWFDLIFGFKQRGEKAESAYNIYMGTSYQSLVNIENFKDSDIRNTLMRLVEVGITPNQLFEIKCKAKYDKDFVLAKNPKYSLSRGEFIYESDTLITKYIKSINYNKIIERFNLDNTNNELKIYPKIKKIKYIAKDIINIFTNCDLFFSIKINSINDNIEESEINEIENQSSKFTPSYLISDIIPPVVISNDNKYFFKGGFWDGRVEISSLNKDIDKYFNCFYPNIDDPVVHMKISLDDKFLLCGTLNGILVVIKIINKNKNLYFHIYKKIYDHNDIITSIFICDKLNICSTCAKDGNILLYTMPKFKLARCIKILLDNNNNENNIYADNIFLSSTPLPCISVYISEKKIFKNYSVNGLPINEVEEIDNTNYITSSKVIHDLNFQEYLIYGTNNAFIKIRKFPELNLINSIEFENKNPIEAFDISLDHRFCFVNNTNENFAIFYEPNANKIENSNNKEKKQK